MAQKPPSLAGPLWVIAVGILILSIGASFTVYMLWDKRKARPELETSSPISEQMRETQKTNPYTVRNRVLPPSTGPAQQSSTAGDQSRGANLVETASIPVTSNATVVLPPPPRESKLPLLSGAAISGRPVGTISGHVALRGTPPEEKPLPLDAMCGKLHDPAQQPTTRFYVVSPDGGLADVFVYLRSGTDGRKYPLSTNTPVIDQRGCIFVPTVIGLQTAQPMILRNSDPVLHNNHFTPTVQGNPEINKAQMPRGADQVYTWPEPEVFLRLKCDVHPWMFAYIGVVNHPFFAVTDGNGRYEFTAPPPGRYVIEAVHRKTHQRGGNGLQREVTLQANENLQIDFEIVLQQ